MSAIDYSDSHLPPELSTGDRRKRDVDPATTPRRRINDTLFNRLRWPAFLVLWFAIGLIVLGYLIDAVGQ